MLQNHIYRKHWAWEKNLKDLEKEKIKVPLPQNLHLEEMDDSFFMNFIWNLASYSIIPTVGHF